jgi:hypothetical protein
MEKLKGHSMFTGNKLTNLEKCEDCRVKALQTEVHAMHKVHNFLSIKTSPK